MAQPASQTNSGAQAIDTIYDSAGTSAVKLAIGNKAVGAFTPPAKWQGVATHQDGDTFGTSDGIVVAGGLVGGTTPVKAIDVDSAGRQVVVGAAAAAAAISGNPVLIGGSDGTNARAQLVDTAGRALVSGAAASGAAVAGNPVLMGGSDGTNARSFATDATGHQQVAQGAATDGAGTWAALRTPNVFKTAAATASGNTALWTPTSGKKFRLMRLMVTVPTNASLAAGAVFTITFQDATTGLNIAFDIYVPTTAVTTVAGTGFSSGWVDLGNGILSAVANNVLNINLSAALVTGTCRVTCAGVEE